MRLLLTVEALAPSRGPISGSNGRPRVHFTSKQLPFTFTYSRGMGRVSPWEINAFREYEPRWYHAFPHEGFAELLADGFRDGTTLDPLELVLFSSAVEAQLEPVLALTDHWFTMFRQDALAAPPTELERTIDYGVRRLNQELELDA